MQSKGKLVSAAMAALMGVGLGGIVLETHAASMEKCYGIVKAGKNSCNTSKHACSAQAKTDADGSEWLFLPKGTCEKITGGSLAPIATVAPVAPATPVAPAVSAPVAPTEPATTPAHSAAEPAQESPAPDQSATIPVEENAPAVPATMSDE